MARELKQASADLSEASACSDLDSRPGLRRFEPDPSPSNRMGDNNKKNSQEDDRGRPSKLVAGCIRKYIPRKRREHPGKKKRTKRRQTSDRALKGAPAGVADPLGEYAAQHDIKLRAFTASLSLLNGKASKRVRPLASPLKSRRQQPAKWSSSSERGAQSHNSPGLKKQALLQARHKLKPVYRTTEHVRRRSFCTSSEPEDGFTPGESGSEGDLQHDGERQLIKGKSSRFFKAVQCQQRPAFAPSMKENRRLRLEGEFRTAKKQGDSIQVHADKAGMKETSGRQGASELSSESSDSEGQQEMYHKRLSKGSERGTEQRHAAGAAQLSVKNCTLPEHLQMGQDPQRSGKHKAPESLHELNRDEQQAVLKQLMEKLESRAQKLAVKARLEQDAKAARNPETATVTLPPHAATKPKPVASAAGLEESAQLTASALRTASNLPLTPPQACLSSAEKSLIGAKSMADSKWPSGVTHESSHQEAIPKGKKPGGELLPEVNLDLDEPELLDPGGCDEAGGGPASSSPKAGWKPPSKRSASAGGLRSLELDASWQLHSPRSQSLLHSPFSQKEDLHAARLSECGPPDPERGCRPLSRKRRLGTLACPFYDMPPHLSPELLPCELESPEPLDLGYGKLAADAAFDNQQSLGLPGVAGRDCYECLPEVAGKEALLGSQCTLNLHAVPESNGQDKLPQIDFDFKGARSDEADLEFDMDLYQQQPKEGTWMPPFRNSRNQHQRTHSSLGNDPYAHLAPDLDLNLGEQRKEAGWHECPPPERDDFSHILGMPPEEDDAPAGWGDDVMSNRKLGDAEPPFSSDVLGLPLSTRVRAVAEAWEAAGRLQSIAQVSPSVLDKLDSEGQVGLDDPAGIAARSPFLDFRVDDEFAA